MDFKEYQDFIEKTAVYDESHKIIYPALGLGNEAGEVQGKVKKVLRDNNGEFTDEAKKAIGKELGDVLWYLAATAKDLGISLESIAKDNVEKLLDRLERGVIQGSGDER